MKVSKERLRDIIEEEVLNLSEEDVELEPGEPEEFRTIRARKTSCGDASARIGSSCYEANWPAPGRR